MEGLKKRCFIFGSILIIAGICITLIPRRANAAIDEKWMEDKSPMTLAGYQFDASPENPKQSYKMDDRTYQLLQPYGIVSRRYVGRGVDYDVVLIASNNDDSFHDPRICFGAQGWTIEGQKFVSVEVPGRGKIPISLVTMSSEREKGKLAAFFYKTPKGYQSSTAGITLSIFMGPLTGNFNTDAVFYRFMPAEGNPSEEELKAFIVKYMEAAGKVSGGYF